MDSVTLELCGSRDYFDSSLLEKKTDLIVTLKRESLCLQPRYRIIRIVHACPDIS